MCIRDRQQKALNQQPFQVHSSKKNIKPFAQVKRKISEGVTNVLVERQHFLGQTQPPSNREGSVNQKSSNDERKGQTPQNRIKTKRGEHQANIKQLSAELIEQDQKYQLIQGKKKRQ
eukprot:TRINITY_DN6462_c0_g1_i1.p2 TRINITY_DN6462_c0_g1~~TRINITY_DN6462_c0_g1_i1.p2  ORF type:complete len:126 (-),score=12.54 TRINITY_DN6462_c0_g1_i1:90-440(-)